MDATLSRLRSGLRTDHVVLVTSLTLAARISTLTRKSLCVLNARDGPGW